jgi:hypothetical protein
MLRRMSERLTHQAASDGVGDIGWRMVMSGLSTHVRVG